jgi:hypothetical protein
MFSTMRRRLHLTPSTVIATLALVFAMSGGAYAAKRYLITSTKQISPKVLKALNGKNGKSGTNGTNGAVGPQGPAGPQGLQGAAGSGLQGKEGPTGKDGVSVTSTTLAAKNATCPEGGSKFTATSGTTYACNGEKGNEGTFEGKALPAGKTLRGAWALAGGESTFGLAKTAVSFAAPAAVTGAANYIGTEEGENEEESKWAPAIKEGKCKGSAEEPAAAEGELCVFANSEGNLAARPNVNLTGHPEAIFGLVIAAVKAAAGPFQAEGTWAVTG